METPKLAVTKEQINKYLPYVLGLLILLALLGNLFNTYYQGTNVDSLKTEIKFLQKNLDSVLNENKAIDKKITNYESRIAEIDKSLKVNNNKIEKLHQYEKSKIDSFKSFSAKQWEMYFTERYTGKKLSEY